jgi:hypothetical protein
VFEPTVPSITRELELAAEMAGASVSVRAEFVPDALDILLAGDEARYNQMIADAARQMLKDDPSTSCVALAMFSMACAGPETQQAIDVPVLTSPQSAVLKLQRLLSAGGAADGTGYERAINGVATTFRIAREGTGEQVGQRL